MNEHINETMENLTEEVKEHADVVKEKIQEAAANNDKIYYILMIIFAILGIVFFPAFIVVIVIYFVKLRPKMNKIIKEEFVDDIPEEDEQQ